ncbi:hypothetical protein SDC9_207150 [bioreactor metagenome]|uniref:Uncharacterized protein n=1 Tax=bioreactor metagenome TaxID=1076179 RepID=A0A645J9M6_9ZZZZ
MGLPMNSLRFSIYLVETCEAGTNARIPLMSAIRPPLTTSLPTASKIVSSMFSWLIRSSQIFLLSTFFRERMTLPSPSFTFVTSTSILSPSLKSSSALTSESLDNSPTGMTPSDLYPMLTNTSPSTTEITVPSSTCPP